MQDEHTKIWLEIQGMKHKIVALESGLSRMKSETKEALDRIADTLDQLLAGERPEASEAASKIKEEIETMWDWIHGIDKDLKIVNSDLKKNGLKTTLSY